MVKFLLDWFSRLDADSHLRPADLAFEDPSSLKRVRTVGPCRLAGVLALARLPHGAGCGRCQRR